MYSGFDYDGKPLISELRSVDHQRACGEWIPKEKEIIAAHYQNSRVLSILDRGNEETSSENEGSEHLTTQSL